MIGFVLAPIIFARNAIVAIRERRARRKSEPQILPPKSPRLTFFQVSLITNILLVPILAAVTAALIALALPFVLILAGIILTIVLAKALFGSGGNAKE